MTLSTQPLQIPCPTPVASHRAALLIVPRSGIAVFSAQVLAWLVLELRPLARASPEVRRWLRWMIGCFLAGFGFWIADKRRFVCAPDNHVINGHAIWHLATSACLALFFEYESSQRAAAK